MTWARGSSTGMKAGSTGLVPEQPFVILTLLNFEVSVLLSLNRDWRKGVARGVRCPVPLHTMYVNTYTHDSGQCPGILIRVFGVHISVDAR
jgi:hypothetical protein